VAKAVMAKAVMAKEAEQWESKKIALTAAGLTWPENALVEIPKEARPILGNRRSHITVQ